MLAGINLLVLVFVVILVPETKGRSLEEMLSYFVELSGDQAPPLWLVQDAGTKGKAVVAKTWTITSSNIYSYTM